jgi:hypothetical protein
VRQKHLTDFETDPPIATMKRACKSVAFRYRAVGYYHSHEKWMNGGGFHPHLHILVWVPQNKEDLWLAGLRHQLSKADKHQIFSLSTSNDWKRPDEFGTEQLVWQHVHYLAGDDNTPRPKSPLRVFSQESLLLG